MHIVLVEPEIPANTGNIARTCAATGTALHLVRPLGFSTEDKYLKRAGLDYWHLVDIFYYDSFEEFTANCRDRRFYLSTTKAPRYYTEVSYEPDSALVFGKETKGLSAEILNAYPESQIRIPMIGEARSLNLGNSVAVVLYEALRQQGFKGLK
ncbi:tRNA (uridine(34)/cytosine(34)/5-carboxymethylaminomethyluridine(34)-2'-O)-methyltransferase TrmL [Pelotomaculum terephthalicicum JT]|uniref:tRNA (uridine(34)/cytosine(34)/5- carboxymethylaminomethyluridine(34)-2'-O)- methyltransferase TrmL n=1 Tax=Pelotomaculum TaxID=191373 RepID=UPI0009D4D92D|nr:MULTISPECIES: tRNA (uridine(34)/cytosine(34)/5-carboxymethylaminomethyluridine(34)-2'-O)-methyltransferase TrmL [Pelotomaculum]MCG9968863.1 tRNA (uridine(34)/cytosine(34)/5-carboxymethylaminomethyluridine(34)-2'-O)-methyltransferase TrmL [Pelotomaculum terephthalicicum JT]OPX85076.1 MAG: tRNA (cytidine(34)-2'-O)-methyltransferase [Pelotomaculum sp. PtaB.Bin117]